jgi:hypothetical protein
LPRFHEPGGMFALQRLDAGHFVRRQYPLTGFYQGGRLPVQRGQVGHFHIGQRIRFRIEPIATLVRLEIGLIVKNARHGAWRWSRQCRVCGPHPRVRAASNG